MARVRLLHWKASEAKKQIEILRRAGHRVDYEEQFRPGLMKEWRESPPAAFVLDLSRLPSHGREIAIALRQSPRTRLVPIVFCDGAEEKIQRVRNDLPDAAFCALADLPKTLRQVLANPPSNPQKPTQMMDRYGSRTAAQKLGIKDSSLVAAIDPPRDFKQVIGALPATAKIRECSLDEIPDLPVNGNGTFSVILCFVRDAVVLAASLSKLRHFAGTAKLWMLWRKAGLTARHKASQGAVGEINERIVRETGIELGLVDYKICSVNPVWSGMLFARRR